MSGVVMTHLHEPPFDKGRHNKKLWLNKELNPRRNPFSFSFNPLNKVIYEVLNVKGICDYPPPRLHVHFCIMSHNFEMSSLSLGHPFVISRNFETLQELAQHLVINCQDYFGSTL